MTIFGDLPQGNRLYLMIDVISLLIPEKHNNNNKNNNNNNNNNNNGL